jgi:hypothetical protein
MIGQPRSRQRGIVFMIAGAGLTLACMAILSVVATRMAESNTSPNGPLKLVLARVLAGTIVDRVDAPSAWR